MKRFLNWKFIVPIVIVIMLTVALVLILVLPNKDNGDKPPNNSSGNTNQQPVNPSNPSDTPTNPDDGNSGIDQGGNGNPDDGNDSGTTPPTDTDQPSNPGDNPQQPEPPLVVKYTLTFSADGQVVNTQEFIDENSQITLPIVPEKNGYTGKWAEYDLTLKENQTIEAVYTPIEYKIEFHMVKINSEDVEVDYLGSWDEFWCVKSTLISNKTATRNYTIETEDITNLSINMVGLRVDALKTVWFDGFYTDENCTQKFSGTIAKGTMGNIVLYAKVDRIEIGGI